MPTKSKKTISKTLMLWAALRKKEFEFDTQPPQASENILTQALEPILTELDEPLTT